jgi:signal peptidase II
VNRTPSRTPLVVVGIAAAVLDLVTKWWVFEAYPYQQAHPVLGEVLWFRPVHNDAGPWSWGQGWSFLRYLLPVLSVAAVAVIGRIWWRSDPADRVKGLGLVLILGGALGNLWDRAWTLWDAAHGGVRDFLLVRGAWFRTDGAGLRFWDWTWGTDFPAFNLADTWITVGVVLVGWRILFEKPVPGPAPAAGGAPPADAAPPPPADPAAAREASA